MPRISHTIRRNHVLKGKLAISAREIPIPRIGVNGTKGALNGRGKSGRRTRKIQTPALTITNAKSVPMDVSWPKTLIGRRLAKSATQKPTTIDDIQGVRNFG